MCVPDGFNTAPTASLTVSEDPTVGEPVTFTPTATDPDSPERLSYAWDLNGDGTYETAGQQVMATYATAGDRMVSHRVTDDCAASDTAIRTITVEASGRLGKVTQLVPDDLDASDIFRFSLVVAGDILAVGAYLDDNAGSNAGAVYVFQ